MDINKDGILTLGETEIHETTLKSKCINVNIYIIPRD